MIAGLLRAYDIPFVAVNPGASFRGLHDSIVNFGGNRPEMITCPHEKLAVCLAHGYTKATGRPMAVAVHDIVGLLHASLGMYLATVDRAPVIVLGGTGPMAVDRRRPRTDWDHTALVQGNAVRDFVKWDDQPVGTAAVVESFARAYRVATTEPQGPVYLCFDSAYQEDAVDPGALDGVRPVPPYTRLGAAEEALEEVAERLCAARRPVLVAERVGRDRAALASLRELADLAGAAVLDLGASFNFPNTHPLFAWGKEALRQADLIVALDVRDLYGCLTRTRHDDRTSVAIPPAGCAVVEIGTGDLGIRAWSHHFQRLTSADLSVLADTGAVLPALVRLCRGRALDEGALAERREFWAGFNRTQKERLLERGRERWDRSPVSLPRLAAETWEAVRAEGADWVLSGNTLNDWARRYWPVDGPERFIGRSPGLSSQLGISLGAALANRDSGRIVVDFQADGDLMFDAGGLWVASHHRLPLLVVMNNNRAYFNDLHHQDLVAANRGRPVDVAHIGTGLDDPAPDFAGLARSMNWYAEGPVERPEELAAALRRAVRTVARERRPALVDVITEAAGAVTEGAG